jgi:hypothetical protein
MRLSSPTSLRANPLQCKGQMVLNVVDFHEKASRFRKNAPRRSAEGAVADIPSLVARAKGLQLKARTELHDAILMLDLAAQHARQLGKIIRDPALKKRFDDELLTVEELLQLARDKTMEL